MSVSEIQATSIKENDLDELIRLSPDYNKGELHKEPVYVVMGVDVQHDRLFYATAAFFLDGSTSLIDYGEAFTFAELDSICQKQYLVKDTGKYVGYTFGVIDYGYAARKEETLDFCIQSGFKFKPVLGRAGAQIKGTIQAMTIQHKGYPVHGFLLNDATFKNTLFIRLIKERAAKLYLPQNAKYDKMLREHLTSEHLVERIKEGKKVLEWVLRTKQNHISDCLKYIIAAKTLVEPVLQQMRQPAPAQVATASTEQPEPERDYSGW